MSDKSIIIIGAGLAGLSAGCYARINGYQSRIFEHHSTPGGVVTSWKRKGYTIDYAPHFLMGHKPGQSLYKLYKELNIVQNIRAIDMDSYACFFDETSGYHIKIGPDMERLANDLKNLSPEDSCLVDDLISAARLMQSFDMGKMGMETAPELMGFWGYVKQMWEMRGVIKYLSGKYAKPVDEYVQTVNHPLLREILKNLFLPEVPVWFILVLLGMLANKQLGLLEDGGLNFAAAIENNYKNLGGQITYSATVEEILVKDDRAIGIRLSDDSKHYADIVISAADGYSTIFKLLGGRYVDKKIEEQYQNWKLFRPMVMISFGVAREFSNEPHLTVVKLRQPFTVGKQTIDGFFIRICNYTSKFASAGKTVIQISFETDWALWNDLHKDKTCYNSEKEQTAKKMLEWLETRYEGISAQIEMTDVATPYTTWRYTLNHKGAFEGWLPTPKTIMTRVSKTLPGLENFYMIGQWVLPGGGVPPCLYSGRQIIQILCNKDKRQFAVSPV